MKFPSHLKCDGKNVSEMGPRAKLPSHISSRAKLPSHILQGQIAQPHLPGPMSSRTLIIWYILYDFLQYLPSSVQTAGVGGLRHNTALLGWPYSWRKEADESSWRVFIGTSCRIKMAESPYNIYRKISNIRHQIPKLKCFSSWLAVFLSAIYWSQVLSGEWRCSWSSADRPCSYIWVINNLIAYWSVSHKRLDSMVCIQCNAAITWPVISNILTKDTHPLWGWSMWCVVSLISDLCSESMQCWMHYFVILNHIAAPDWIYGLVPDTSVFSRITREMLFTWQVKNWLKMSNRFPVETIDMLSNRILWIEGNVKVFCELFIAQLGIA